MRVIKGLLTCSIFFFISNMAFAEFEVRKKNWPVTLPKNASWPNEDSSRRDKNIYDQVAAEDTAASAQLRLFKPMVSDENRFYMKFGVNTSSIEVKKISNNASPPSLPQTLVPVASSRDSNSQKKFQAGFGYLWKHWRVDGDYFFNKKLKYNKNPLFSSGFGIINSHVHSRNLLMNLYYDFQRFLVFRPFIALSSGFSLNKTVAVASNIGSPTHDGQRVVKKNLNFAFGTKIGLRIKIMESNFFVSTAYQYAKLGKAKWRDKNFPQPLNLTGNLSWNGFRLDMVYML